MFEIHNGVKVMHVINYCNTHIAMQHVNNPPPPHYPQMMEVV